MRRRALVLALPAAAGFAPCALAQATGSATNRPIRIVVPYPAGGPVDAAARQLARGMAEQLAQTVIVENKPGAGSTLGAAEVAKSAPDGHTLLFALPDSFTYVPQLFKRLPYDPAKDLAPITQVALTQPVMVLRADAAIASLRQLGKGSPAMSFGTWGQGTYPHLIAAALARVTGADLNIVAYKGGAPAVQDFMGGHIQMTIAGIPQALDMQGKGLARIVAVAGTERSKLVPDVPTFVEQGFTEPTFSLPLWLGLAAPAGTPAAVLGRLADAATATLRSAEMQRFLQGFGWSALGNSAAEFRAALEREAPIVASAMRAAGVQPE
ncbi:MAG: tripartite tricarboxylate transporter substrate binding protein [Burkholderiales bacterium]|nr:tripartite tricarboxylate transporter substrate binding protein [Burkholderiales bacterium]